MATLRPWRKSRLGHLRITDDASGVYAADFASLVRFDPAEALENDGIGRLRQVREVATGLAGFGSLLLMHALLMPDTPGWPRCGAGSELGISQVLMSLARQARQPRCIANAIAACLHPMYVELCLPLSELAASGPPLLRPAADEKHDPQHSMETWLSVLRELVPRPLTFTGSGASSESR